jgi:hypothetical protein
MEDVDRSCVHVVMMIGVVFAVLSYIIFPAGIFDIPFAELTSGPVLRLTGSVIAGGLAILILIDVRAVFIKR